MLKFYELEKDLFFTRWDMSLSKYQRYEESKKKIDEYYLEDRMASNGIVKEHLYCRYYKKKRKTCEFVSVDLPLVMAFIMGILFSVYVGFSFGLYENLMEGINENKKIVLGEVLDKSPEKINEAERQIDIIVKESSQEFIRDIVINFLKLFMIYSFILFLYFRLNFKKQEIYKYEIEILEKRLDDSVE